MQGQRPMVDNHVGGVPNLLLQRAALASSKDDL